MNGLEAATSLVSIDAPVFTTADAAIRLSVPNGHASVILARPEKALVDFLYLTPARSKLFRALPELEWPKRFNARRARAIVERIVPTRRRTLVTRRLDALLEGRSGD